MSIANFISKLLGNTSNQDIIKNISASTTDNVSLYSGDDVEIDENQKISTFNDGNVLGYNGIVVEHTPIDEPSKDEGTVTEEKSNKKTGLGIAALCVTVAATAATLITRKKINDDKLTKNIESIGSKQNSASSIKSSWSKIADFTGISSNAKTKKAILKDTIAPVKTKEEKEILNSLLDGLMAKNFDLKLISSKYYYHEFADTIKHSSNPEEFTKVVIDVLTKHKDNEVVFRSLENYLHTAHYKTPDAIKPQEVINFYNSIHKSNISSEHLFTILAKRDKSPIAMISGDPFYLSATFNFSAQDWNSLSEILPTLSKSNPMSKLNLNATDIIKWSKDLKSLPVKVSPDTKKSLLKALTEVSEQELAEIQAAGVDVYSLKNYLGFYLSKPQIKINEKEMAKHFRNILNKKNEQVIGGENMEKLLNKYASSGIPLEYPRTSFTADLNNSFQKLSQSDKKTLLNQLEITLKDGDFNGIINPDKINIEAFDSSVQPIIKEIKNAANKFVRENAFLCGDAEITGLLNSIKSICPEFMSMSGKIVNGKTIDCEVLEVLNKCINHPSYKYLNDEDKLILKMSAVFQSVGKTANINDLDLSYKLSSMLSKNIFEKYGFTQEIEERILNQISNGSFWSKNTSDVSKYFSLNADRKIATILSETTSKTIGMECIKGEWSKIRYTNPTFAFINTMAKKKYPKVKYTIDNKTYEIPVLDVRNMHPETDMTQYGYIGMKLKDITVQVHNTGTTGMKQLGIAYKDPNFYYALSTSVRRLTNRSNGYGSTGYILSTSKMNRGGGCLTGKEDGVFDYEDFIQKSGLGYSGNGKLKQIYNTKIYPGQFKDPTEQANWYAIAKDAGDVKLNEIFAMRAKPEQIALGEEIACTSNTIPEEYIRISIENGCLPILLTK